MHLPEDGRAFGGGGKRGYAVVISADGPPTGPDGVRGRAEFERDRRSSAIDLAAYGARIAPWTIRALIARAGDCA